MGCEENGLGYLGGEESRMDEGESISEEMEPFPGW